MRVVRHDGPALEIRAASLADLGERYRRYRLADPHAEQAMAQSLGRWGQLTPLVICLRGEQPEVVDGFKRLAAARALAWPTVLVRRLEADDERTVKAALYSLNRVGQHLHELEEAWLVQALVREDGLSQVEAAALLGRHKSWVCRRLASARLCVPTWKSACCRRAWRGNCCGCPRATRPTFSRPPAAMP